MRADLLGYACPAGTDPLAGHDNPAQALITCDTAGQVRYLLGPAVLDRSAISKATAQTDPNSGSWVVQVTFTSAGTKTWGDLTSRSIGQQIAFVVNTTVVSAPTVQEAILGSSTQISGNFTQDQAQQLAAALSTR
jgi:preprotein translocase subunit SecD